MLRTAIAIALVIASNNLCADDEVYYECTRPDGLVEYSLFACEDGQEQRRIGGKETIGAGDTKKQKPRQAAPAVPQPRPRQGGEEGSSRDYPLAAYKCVGKSGDILYTDARDYLAFETYRCKQIIPGVACVEAHELKTRDPLAVISIKLVCP